MPSSGPAAKSGSSLNEAARAVNSGRGTPLAAALAATRQRTRLLMMLAHLAAMVLNSSKLCAPKREGAAYGWFALAMVWRTSSGTISRRD